MKMRGRIVKVGCLYPLCSQIEMSIMYLLVKFTYSSLPFLFFVCVCAGAGGADMDFGDIDFSVGNTFVA